MRLTSRSSTTTSPQAISATHRGRREARRARCRRSTRPPARAAGPPSAQCAGSCTATATSAPVAPREIAHAACAASAVDRREARVIERGEPQLHRLRLDQPRRRAGHVEGRDGHPRPALRVEPRHLPRRPAVHAREGERARRAPAPRAAARARRHRAARRRRRPGSGSRDRAGSRGSSPRVTSPGGCAPRAPRASPRCARSRGRGGRCGRSSSRPRAMSPAITRHAEARRSVAITLAPASRGTPRTMAALPSTSMSAPRRFSSCTCIMRFSKIVSVMTEVPSATLASAIICACMSVGNAGNGAVRRLNGRIGPSRRTRSAPSPDVDGRARLAQLLEHRVERAVEVALERHVAAGRRRGGGEGPGLDAVGHDRVRGAVQRVHAVDHDAVGARAGDPRAHRDEAAREVHHLRLARRVLEDGPALGERRRHHQVLGAGDGHHVEHVARALEAAGAGRDVAVLEVDLGAHRLEPLDVLVDRPQADRAAAGQRHARLAAAGEQRPEHEDRGAHRLDELVGRERPVELRRGQRQAVPVGRRARRPSARAACASCARR